MDVAQQQRDPSAPPQDAASPFLSPPATAQAQDDEAPPDGRKPGALDYAALRPELSAQGRRSKAATEALGLDKNATADEIATAIEALKRRTAGTDRMELPKELREEQDRLVARAWQSAERDFGEDFTLQAQGLVELVYNTDDPYELTAALHQMAQAIKSPPQEQPGQAAPAHQAAPPPQERPGVDMEVGQPGWKVQVDEDVDKPGSGDTRGFFQRVLGAR